MKAFILDRYGKQERLRAADVPEPESCQLKLSKRGYLIVIYPKIFCFIIYLLFTYNLFLITN